VQFTSLLNSHARAPGLTDAITSLLDHLDKS
jgi:hypothetical protein